jgi:hypothetical protein
MFDTNNFKRSVKTWVRDNPTGSMADLLDFCESIVPAHQYAAHEWIIEQTAGWYQHILSQRKTQSLINEEEATVC